MPKFGIAHVAVAVVIVTASTAAAAVVRSGADEEVVTVSTAAAGAGRSGPDEEARSFAADAQISESRAAGLLEDQGRYGAVDAELVRRLGDDFGGLWVEDGTQLVIGVAAAENAEQKAIVRTVVARAGVQEAAEIAWRHTSQRKLLRVQAQLDRQVEPLNARSPHTIDVEPDLPAGRLLLSLPAQPTPAQSAYAERLRHAELGVDIEVTRRESELRAWSERSPGTTPGTTPTP